jgi:alpha-beta hydrolase superfamily lysophospholipase/SAM-dependent methyltransferase
MKAERSLAWRCAESGFDCSDGTRLFYRSWQPAAPRQDGARRALVFLHRGHEHSGRIQPLVEQFGFTRDWAFAWDARGHGHSPGERGDAPGFEALVEDFDTFIRHIGEAHGFAPENILVVANSVGAVIAATWLHDYAPRVRGVIMAAAAFEIKLYVPLAKPALRFARRFKPQLFVTSYIRSSMLTHSPQEAAAYDADPLIAKAISACVLLGLADTAKRIVHDAAAIDTPVLMLAAGKDYVVKEEPQQTFHDRLSSPLKRYVRLPDAFHALFYERDTGVALHESRQFIEQCFQRAQPAPSHYLNADRDSHSAQRYAALLAGNSCGPLARAWFGLQRAMLSLMGPVSDGMRIGLEHGFDSGASLDYVYRNQAGGRFGMGTFMDRGYLDAVGWRGIRLRKQQLQKMLGERIAAHRGDAPLRILDVAAGSGRYVLETLKRFQDRRIELTLRDYTQHNLDQARALAGRLDLGASIDYQLRDAFSADSYRAAEGVYDIVIVSGLYELFSDNEPVVAALKGIAGVLRAGGYLIYTGQPWHPQLDMIALTLTSHRGTPWRMRPRPQAEMDGLVAHAGCAKVATSIGLEGIFTVSLAQKPAAPGAGG